MLQESQGWVKRPQGRPQVTQNWAWAAVTLQEKPQVATEPQEMWAVAQSLEAKVCGAAKPPPQAFELLQPQVDSSA